MYTTAVGVILPRQLARFENVGLWRCSVRFAHTAHAIKLGQYLTDVIANALSNTRSARCARTAHASLMGAYAPKRSANRALSREGRSLRARG